MPTVSIVIPVYNVEKYLRECLDSALNQTLKDIEIIRVDDGSPDNCGKILDEYAAKDNRIKVIHQENKGTHLARKAGVLASTGDYVMFLDSDDKYTMDACETAYNVIREKDVDILKFGMTFFSDNGILPAGAIEYNKMGLQCCGYLSTRKQILEMMYSENNSKPVFLWDKIFKGEVVRKAYNEITDCRLLFCEDTFAFLYIMWFSNTLDSISNRLYFYRYGYGISTCKVSEFVVQHVSSALSTNPLLQDFADKQEKEGKDVTDFRKAIDQFTYRQLNSFFNRIQQLQDDSLVLQLLGDCFKILPIHSAKKVWQIIKRHQTEKNEIQQNQQNQQNLIHMLYEKIEILQERHDAQNNTKAVRFSRFINKLLGRGK